MIQTERLRIQQNGVVGAFAFVSHQHLALKVQGWGFGFPVLGFVFRVSGFGFEVYGLGFMV